MSIALETKNNKSVKETKSAALLNKYLTNAVDLTHSDTYIGAHKTLNEYASRDAWNDIEQKDIDAKRAEVKAEMKQYGLKEKAAFYANLRSGEHTRETLIKAGIFAVAACVANAVDPVAGQAIAGAAVLYGASKMAAGTIGESKNPKQLFSSRDYADLKHADMALRKLSSALQKKELDAMRREAIIRGVYMPVYR